MEIIVARYRAHQGDGKAMLVWLTRYAPFVADWWVLMACASTDYVQVHRIFGPAPITRGGDAFPAFSQGAPERVFVPSLRLLAPTAPPALCAASYGV